MIPITETHKPGSIAYAVENSRFKTPLQLHKNVLSSMVKNLELYQQLITQLEKQGATIDENGKIFLGDEQKKTC